MHRRDVRIAAPLLLVGIISGALLAWSLLRSEAADKAQPQPPYVDPGGPGAAPADAVVLFDGKDLSKWVHTNGSPTKWEVVDGEMVCKPRSGSIMTREKFGDQQLHVEFATPYMPDAKVQGRGNSGVYLQGRYEIQVLDSFHNETYPNGSCGALYNQLALTVNVCRPPRQWQTYDIVFHAPKCDASGNVTKPATLTVVHNGVLIHDHVTINGVCPGPLDEKVCEPGPLMFQDHGNTVKFRNIWLRPLPSGD